MLEINKPFKINYSFFSREATQFTLLCIQGSNLMVQGTIRMAEIEPVLATCKAAPYLLYYCSGSTNLL